MSQNINKQTVRIQSKSDVSANWIENNPTLLMNEIGYELDTGGYKIGDGVTPWIGLQYFSLGKRDESGNVILAGTDQTLATQTYVDEAIANISSTGEDLEPIVVGLNETVPVGSIPSICDFNLIPTTQSAYYYSGNSKFWTTTANNLYGSEIPLATTKGYIVVKDITGVERYRKEIR